MQLTQRQIFGIGEALILIGGFSFNAETTKAMMRNKFIFDPLYKSLFAARSAIIDSIAKNGQAALYPGTAEHKKFNDEWEKFLNAGKQENVNFIPITFTDLQLDRNNIPLSVIEALEPIWKEKEKKGK